MDENGKLQFMNRAAFAATGCTEEDFRKGLNAFQMFALEDHDRAMQGIRRIMTGETIGGREFTVLRRDGTTFPVIVYTAPIMREGKTVGVRGIAIDITDRKRAEEELRAARERLDYVVTSNPAVIFTGKPRADYSDYELTYMSESVVSMLGFEPGQFLVTRSSGMVVSILTTCAAISMEFRSCGRKDSAPSSTGFCTRTERIGGYVKKRR